MPYMKRLNRLIRRMGKLPGRMDVLAADLIAGSARRAAQAAREAVPVDSGELRSSISASGAGGVAVVSATAAHAAMVEYGTSRMAAQPYMQPAAEAERENMRRDAQTRFHQAAKEI